MAKCSACPVPIGLACRGEALAGLKCTSERYRAYFLRRATDARDEPPLPPIRRQVGGFLASAARVVRSRGKKADGPEVARRLAICEACDHFRASDQRCGKAKGCGCHTPTKAAWQAARCPEGKW